MRKIGWIFKFKEIGGYEGIWSSREPVFCLNDAWVLKSRSVARFLKLSDRTILKVMLDKNGKPVKIIGRG